MRESMTADRTRLPKSPRLRKSAYERYLPLLLFGLGLAFLLAFHRYNLWDMVEGWVVSDEGHQLYQPLRWMSGQMFYRDFTTDNYPPGMISLHAILFSLFGVRMSVLRVFLALVGAGIATLSYVLARKIMPAGWAILAFLLCLTWNVTNFNIGFPSWYCVLLGLAAMLAALRYMRDGRLLWLGLAGALAGVSAFFKVTQGAYVWIGLVAFLTWRSTAGRPRRLWRIENAVALLSALLGLALLRTFPTAMNLALFGLPLVALAGAALAGWPSPPAPLPRGEGGRHVHPATIMASREGEQRAMSAPLPVGEGEGRGRYVHELLALAGGAGIVTLAWAAPSIATLGWGLFLEGTLLAPLRHSSFMRAIVQPPTLNGWLLLVWAVAGGIAIARSRRVNAWLALAYGALGLALLFAPLGAEFSARESLRLAFVTWRGLRFFLLFAGGLGLAALFWRRAVPAAHLPALMLILTVGSWNLLQIYPFADSNHLIWSVQAGFILLAYFAARGWEAARSRMARWPAALAVGLLPAALIALQLYPYAGHFYSLNDGFKPVRYELLDAGRADVYVRADAAQTLRDVGQAIEERTAPGDTLFDTSGSFFYFLTGRHNATHHDFIWPGFLTEAETAGLIAEIDARRPALVIWRETDEHVVGHASFAALFPSISAAIERNYRFEARIGEYALWARRSTEDL